MNELASEFKHLNKNIRFSQTKTLADDDAVGLFLVPSGVAFRVVPATRGFLEVLGAFVPLLAWTRARNKQTITFQDLVAAPLSDLVIDTVRHERQRDPARQHIAHGNQRSRFLAQGLVHLVGQILRQRNVEVFAFQGITQDQAHLGKSKFVENVGHFFNERGYTSEFREKRVNFWWFRSPVTKLVPYTRPTKVLQNPCLDPQNS
jgi:hypothetical protein